MRTKVLAAAALAITLMGAAFLSPDDDGTQPPVNLVPASEMTLSRLLALHAKAVGKSGSTSLKEHWTTHYSGLDGSQDVYVRGDDERIDTVLGDLHSASGVLKGAQWHQNHNGEVIVESGLHRRSAIDGKALASGGPGVALIGKVVDANAYIVRVNPPGGRLEYVYYDITSALITQIDEAYEGTRDIVTYDDFRTTDSVTRAWHYHTITARTGSERDHKLQSISTDAVTDAQLAIPASSTPVRVPDPIATLPAKILSDRIILCTEIGGKSVNLQLDSGADGIVIDKDVLVALHIPLKSNDTGVMAGNYSISQAIAPRIDIGPVSLENVVVDAIPFVQFADDKTPVAGLIGFDFIDGVVLHIDYNAGTVQAIDPAKFTPPANATAIPIALDDNVPMVGATIGHSQSSHFIMDTGADRSTLASAFVLAHPSDTVDQGLGDQLRDAFPFETVFYGVGGKVTYRSTQVGPFTFGGQTFAKWLFDATYGAASFETEDYDGLIGQDVLRYFDVYLDYAHQRVYLTPNERYHNRYGN